MIVMRPIAEQAVLDEINAGRFEGDVEGYIAMDGPEYKGSFLYRVDGGVTQVLDEQLTDAALLDGAVRAAVAAGENRGASAFCVNEECTRLAEWKRVFFGEEGSVIENKKLFHSCKEFS